MAITDGEESERDPLVIEALPTKELFVDMLTRDIGLTRAIIDLVDNSIDGAQRVRGTGDESLDGLRVIIRLDENEFVIEDNCGGIPIELARYYAFRMGRDRTMDATPHSIGQFGVGMKRAFFKLGRWFQVTTKTRSDSFVLTVPVDEWKDDPDWHFKFDEIDEELDVPEEETGTTIVIRELNPEVSSNFALQNYRTRLGMEIQSAQKQFIQRGLHIFYDGTTLIADPWSLLRAGGLEPAFHSETFQFDDLSPVIARVYAGISESSPREAGWYVLCNGRMVLEADQSDSTGWNQTEDTRVIVPKYHNQFARFRGYALFDSEDASLLPWNTTKTGIDQDSRVYKSALPHMVAAMRTVITFLNQLDAETESDEEGTPLNDAVEIAIPCPISEITRTGPFQHPSRATVRRPTTVGIQFRREVDKVDDLKETLGVDSAKAVGETAFDLVYDQFFGDQD